MLRSWPWKQATDGFDRTRCLRLATVILSFKVPTSTLREARAVAGSLHGSDR